MEQYLGNVGSAVMEEVDRALIVSLGIKDIDQSNIIPMQECEEIVEPQKLINIFQYMGEQLRFWQDSLRLWLLVN